MGWMAGVELTDEGSTHEPDIGGTPIKAGLTGDTPKMGAEEAVKSADQGLTKDLATGCQVK